MKKNLIIFGLDKSLPARCQAGLADRREAPTNNVKGGNTLKISPLEKGGLRGI